MNGGLQDAINLAWKLALVYHGAAEPALLDSYEAERRPVAEMVIQSGEVTEHAQTLTDRAERASRDNAMRAAFAESKARHHEVVAEAELNVDYSLSPIVAGDANLRLGPGQRLPDSIQVRPAGAASCGLHALTHRAGHTLVLLGGATARGVEMAELLAALQDFVTDESLFETAIAFATRDELADQIGQLEVAAADLLGVEGIVLLAVRPDGYIGLRADRDYINALERYRALVLGGDPYS
jgi:hypothetical protein